MKSHAVCGAANTAAPYSPTSSWMEEVPAFMGGLGETGCCIAVIDRSEAARRGRTLTSNA